MPVGKKKAGVKRRPRSKPTSRKRTGKAHKSGKLPPKSSYNPALVVTQEEVDPSGRRKQPFEVRVVRDDKLPGGTKQRALVPLLAKRPEKEFVIVAANDGLAQAALSYAANLVGKKATVYVAQRKEPAAATLLAKKLGGNVKGIRPGYLTVRNRRAEDYVKRRNKQEPGSTLLLPLGVNNAEYEAEFLKALKAALPKNFRAPKRVWTAVGSGLLLRTLGRLWPRAKLMAVQVGKEVDLKEVLGPARAKNARLFVEDRYRFEQPTRESLPPYPSMPTYDAKVWDWVRRYGEPGDLVWNVGTDE